MKDYIREFPQADGSTMICEVRGGVRQPTRYVRANGTEAKRAAPKKEPRRIEPKRTGQPAPRAPKRHCKHLGERKSQTLKVLCTTCKGVNNIDQPVNECAVYGRCLPEFRPTGEAADRWYGNEAKGIERRFEADAYHVCHGCTSRELVECALPPAPGGE